MASSLKSIIKYQWVAAIPIFLASTIALSFFYVVDVPSLYVPVTLGTIVGGTCDIDNKLTGKIRNFFIIIGTALFAELAVVFTYDFWLTKYL